MTRLEKLATAVHLRLNDPTVAMALDADALNEHGQQRRWVWISPGGTTTPPDQAGGRLPTGSTTQRKRICRNRVEDVRVHMYAESREACEEMLENLISALSLQLSVADVTRYAWVNENKTATGRNVRSYKCVAEVKIPWPVVEEISALTNVVTHELTSEITS